MEGGFDWGNYGNILLAYLISVLFLDDPIWKSKELTKGFQLLKMWRTSLSLKGSDWIRHDVCPPVSIE